MPSGCDPLGVASGLYPAAQMNTAVNAKMTSSATVATRPDMAASETGFLAGFVWVVRAALSEGRSLNLTCKGASLKVAMCRSGVVILSVWSLPLKAAE